MPDYKILRDEIQNDPLGRGYSGMTDAEVADDLNTQYRTRNRSTLTASEIVNAVDLSEWNALDDVQRQIVWNLLHMGAINPFGVEATILVNVFGAGSNTIAVLAEARVENISRAQELGLGNWVTAHRVGVARSSS